MVAAGFLSRSLNGPEPNVQCHITVWPFGVLLVCDQLPSVTNAYFEKQDVAL